MFDIRRGAFEHQSDFRAGTVAPGKHLAVDVKRANAFILVSVSTRSTYTSYTVGQLIQGEIYSVFGEKKPQCFICSMH